MDIIESAVLQLIDTNTIVRTGAHDDAGSYDDQHRLSQKCTVGNIGIYSYNQVSSD